MLPEPPPSARMMQLIWPSPLVVQAIHVAAKLGIDDRLAAGAQSVDDLARAAGAHGVSLHRLLRALSSLGVFAEEGDGRFRHTELSETLRSDHPQSVHAWAVMLGTHFAWRPWGELHEAVVTGTSSFARLYGEPFFAYLDKHPEDARVFHAAMTSGSAGRLPAVLAAYDFRAFEHIADVGGGHGALLHGILSASPKTWGVLYDLPAVVSGAAALQTGPVAARCEIVGGDFFESVPTGADGYVLSHVIHDWSDEKALRILHNCRRAIRPGGKILLIEGVLKPPNEPDPLKFLDVWFIGGGGQERTESDFGTLLRDAGFSLTRVIPTVRSNAIIEGRPV